MQFLPSPSWTQVSLWLVSATSPRFRANGSLAGVAGAEFTMDAGGAALVVVVVLWQLAGSKPASDTAMAVVICDKPMPQLSRNQAG
jgi:hypothetical protein